MDGVQRGDIIRLKVIRPADMKMNSDFTPTYLTY